MDAVNLFKSVREYFTPVLTTSAFLEKGVLTPDEFVQAGDNLSQACPSWQWQTGEKSKLRSYLPENKQFLLARGVSCFQRVKFLETEESALDINDDSWCAPDIVNSNPGQQHCLDSKSGVEPSSTVVSDDDYFDMESEMLQMSVNETSDEKKTTKGSDAVSTQGKGDINIPMARRYDISITYDNYYKTPRVWLYGYDENGTPLTPEQIYEDIMQDYVKSTVTVDPHPHLSVVHASIHPCKHADIMLSTIKSMINNDRVPHVGQYLFIFLKMFQSVIPTIQYDLVSEIHV